MLKIQAFQVAFYCFWTHQTSKTAVRREKERVTASSGDIFASLTSTMLKLTREATVVQVAYIAMPFWTCEKQKQTTSSSGTKGHKYKCKRPLWPAHGGATGRLCGICWATLRKRGGCGRSRISSRSWSKQLRWGRPEHQPSTWRINTIIMWRLATLPGATWWK